MQRSRSKLLTIAFTTLAALLSLETTVALHAATSASKSKAAAVAHTTKGQGQLAGINGEFGTVYTLKDSFNFAIYSAKYQIDPFASEGGGLEPAADQKLLVLTVSFKNAYTDDNTVGDFGNFISAFDENGQKYDSAQNCDGLEGFGCKTYNHQLKPGQGLGTPEMIKPLRMAISVPGNVHIVKLIVNEGRMNSSDDVVRYYLSGATTANAGAVGDAKNTIAPLTGIVHDPADKDGAVAISVPAVGKPGSPEAVVSGPISMSLTSFVYKDAGAQIAGNSPDDGHKWAVATFHIKNISEHEAQLYYQYDDSATQIKDQNGDTYKPQGVLKGTSDDTPDGDRKLQPGEEYTYRFYFQLPQSSTAQEIVASARDQRQWRWDNTGVQ